MTDGASQIFEDTLMASETLLGEVLTLEEVQSLADVKTIRSLRAELGEHLEFEKELDMIRKAYGAKRNFMKLLATLT
jgi:UDP-N-acetylglucosamine enolpyruvyl transferase